MSLSNQILCWPLKKEKSSKLDWDTAARHGGKHMSCQSNRLGFLSLFPLIASEVSWAICLLYRSLIYKMGTISSNTAWRLLRG